MPSPLKFVAATLLSTAVAAATDSTNRPVVGIYSAPDRSRKGYDYAAASYVKWLESAGAQSVPILYDITDADLEKLMPQLNGVLLPGGGAGLPSGAAKMFELAIEANNNGTYFPVWGTCLGFEWLMKIVGGDDVLGDGFDSENISLALNLTAEAATSRLLGPTTSVPGHRDRSASMAADLQSDLANANNPVAMNNHQAGVEPHVFSKSTKLTSFFRILSTNKDRKGREFVSTVEAVKYPIYGTQWHPEKNNFEFGVASTGQPYEVINHSPEAVYASQSLANFFVGECRRNGNQLDANTNLFWDYNISQEKAPEFQQIYQMAA